MAESVNPDLNVGLFAIPNTDDEADAKLDVDVGICIAVNKKSSHLQETLKVLDYISDNTDKEGWMHCTADTMGAAPAAMEFETQVAAQYYKDYTAYMESGNSKPWIYLQLPSGIADVVGPAVQGYFAGSSDMEQTLQSMDTGCKELLE